jgi:hypothetical protein
VSTDLEYNKSVFKDTAAKLQAMGEEYGLEHAPENVKRALKDILTSEYPDIKSASALMKMEMACLAAWSRGEIDGPDSVESLERRAKQAESLAKMMDKKDNPKGAKKQRDRAAVLRERAALQSTKEKTI